MLIYAAESAALTVVLDRLRPAEVDLLVGPVLGFVGPLKTTPRLSQDGEWLSESGGDWTVAISPDRLQRNNGHGWVSVADPRAALYGPNSPQVIELLDQIARAQPKTWSALIQMRVFQSTATESALASALDSEAVDEAA